MTHSFYKGKVKVADSHWDRFIEHKTGWKFCKRCGLHKTRKRVVFFRGRIPADVALIGEAPGEAEDSIGIPFCGPAGHLLDRIIQGAVAKIQLADPNWKVNHGWPVKLCIFNLVNCFPRDVDPDELSSGSIRQPGREEIEACRPRLLEFIKLVEPRAIVTLGALAKKNVPPELDAVPIIHPAAILRQSDHQAALSIKRAVLTLVEVFRSVAKVGT
jgi:uracil-DNA glycosylase